MPFGYKISHNDKRNIHTFVFFLKVKWQNMNIACKKAYPISQFKYNRLVCLVLNILNKREGFQE